MIAEAKVERANNRQKGREGGWVAESKHDRGRAGEEGEGSGQRLAGSRADSSQELFEKMRWEKGKRQSDTGIRESVIDFCVYACVALHFV